ncbi:regulatory YrvL family protein [Coprobacillus cateniformis]|uniref:regulatory YrvL family protein n=1 Tax=Coprobacillus cateniformis TaxID=100884 RepID=UPI002675C4FE|nr:regulatory YrvL family protein [Coprobacillus cateniformis]
MKKFWIDNKDKIITFIICGTIFIEMLSIIALVSGTVMKLFGFQYESIGSIILFFIIATIMSFPLNLIAGALPKALYELERISKLDALILYLTLDTIATSFGLKIVDYYMSSVSATTLSIVVISFLLALPGRDDFKDK